MAQCLFHRRPQEWLRYDCYARLVPRTEKRYFTCQRCQKPLRFNWFVWQWSKKDWHFTIHYVILRRLMKHRYRIVLFGKSYYLP